jgi:hypothetical protein
VGFGPVETAPIGDELFRTIRPYVRGDSRRRVHWEASAHHGSLMVKESDGTGVTSFRIVVQLDGPGAAAEVAVARAAWLAQAGLARGWRTELVTVQPRSTPVAPASELGSPYSPPPIEIAPTLGATRVVAQPVRDERGAIAVLATAGYGSIAVGPSGTFTCVVSPGGDRWL